MRKNLNAHPVALKPFANKSFGVVDVALAFGHFFAIDKQVAAVKPETCRTVYPKLPLQLQSIIVGRNKLSIPPHPASNSKTLEF